MWSKERTRLWVVLVVFFATSGVRSSAGIRPSFSLDGCVWNATHIVLVETTSKGGVFSVLKSWKGNLNAGETIEIPELKPDEKAAAISDYARLAEGESGKRPSVYEQIPRQPSGSRMILFLKKLQSSETSSPNVPASAWEPASDWGGMKVSVVWIDSGRSYCFLQWMNPGPAALSECVRGPELSSDPDVVTSRIQQVLRVQRELTGAVAAKNADIRIRRLGRIALGDVLPAQRQAFEALGQEGVAALPEILQVLDKPPNFYDGEQLIRVLVEAAGHDSGRVLHARLQGDLSYWKLVGPTLTREWLGQLLEPGSPLHVKFNETALIVQELDREHYVPARETVAELKDFWISHPQLYDPKWGRTGRNGGTAQQAVEHYAFGLAEECHRFIEHINSAH